MSSDENKRAYWLKVNNIYFSLLGLCGVVWLFQINAFGISVGVAAIVIAYFLYQKQRWAYFAAAVWYFGLLRISMDDGYDFFQGYQSYVKLPCFIAIIYAIILHEKLLKPKSN